MEEKFELTPSVPNKHTNHMASGYFGSLEFTPKASTSPEHEGFLWTDDLWDLDQEPRSNYLYSSSFTFPFYLPEIGPISQNSLRTTQESRHTFNTTFFIILIFLIFHACISLTLQLHIEFTLQTNEHLWNHGTPYSAIFLSFAQPQKLFVKYIWESRPY